MTDPANLLSILKLNGITNTSSVDDVNYILAGLKLSEQEKNEAYEILKAQGWTGQRSSPPVPPPPPPPASVSSSSMSTPPPAPVSTSSVPPQSQVATPHHFSALKVSLIVLFLLIFAGVGLAAYTYTKKIGPFGSSSSSINESNFFSSILSKVSEIKSSSYAASVSLGVVPREAGAEPFRVAVSNVAEMRQKYQNDSTRGRDVSLLLTDIPDVVTYPATIDALASSVAARFKSGIKNVFVIDPLTGAKYDYKVTDGGKNFALTVNFETQDAISAIKRRSSYFPYSSTSTPIEGRKVTFTKDSYAFFYIPSEPPKPFFVRMSESLRYISPDTSLALKASASSEWKKEGSSEWIFNLDAQGVFSGISYKANADAMKKATDYYVRINNIPDLFLGYIGLVKGSWIKIPTAGVLEKDKDPYSAENQLFYVKKQTVNFEKEYKEQREHLVRLLKEAMSTADGVKLISFVNPPEKETVDGQKLTRYDLAIRKEAILPFYDALSKKIESDNEIQREVRDFFQDEGLRQYLESPEFDQVFDYFFANTAHTVWIDENGFPVLLQEKVRVVPPDTAIPLKDKQVDFIFKIALSKINEPVIINAPTDARLIDDLVKETIKNDEYSYDPSGAATVKSSLSIIRAQAELEYDKSNSSYGNTPFAIGSCKQTAGTMFAEANIWKYIGEATGGNHASATCVSSGTAGKVASYAISVPLSGDPTYSWCVDSNGISRQIVGALKSATCR